MPKVGAAAKRHKKILGRPAGSPDQMQEYIRQGFLFFQSPSDLGMMRRGARQWLDPLGKKGIDPKTKSLY